MPKRKGPNEGMIRKRPDETWEARISLGYDVLTGKRKTKSFYGKTQVEVRNKLVKAQHAQIQGLPVAVEQQTVSQFLQDWLDNVVSPSLRPKTVCSYKQIVENHLKPGLGRIQLVKLSPQQVQKFLVAKHSSGISAEHLRRVLRTALTHAYRMELIPRNAAAMVKPPTRQTREFAILNQGQVRKFVEQCSSSYLGPLFTLAVATGLREGELLGLSWTDIDLQKFVLTVRKQLQLNSDGKPELVELKTEKSRRTLALPMVAVEALRLQQEQQRMESYDPSGQWSNLVFRNSAGAPLDPSRIRKELKAVLENAKLPHIRFHDLRHSAASLMKEAGADLHTIKNQLGHSQIAITANLYTHVAPSVLRDAADQVQSLFEEPKPSEIQVEQPAMK